MKKNKNQIFIFRALKIPGWNYSELPKSKVIVVRSRPALYGIADVPSACGQDARDPSETAVLKNYCCFESEMEFELELRRRHLRQVIRAV